MVLLAAVLAGTATAPHVATAADPAALVLVTGGLTEPTAIANAGDGSGRLFITERAGKVRVLTGLTLQSTPFLDVGPLITSANPEQGLLGIAFHPQYETNGLFFVDYTNTNGDVVVARYNAPSPSSNAANPLSGQVILTVAHPFTNHNAGQLAFGPDGYLYIAMGDGGSAGDPGNRAQDVNSLLGKILRIDVDGALPYTVPVSNPLVGQPGLDEIWAMGLRNPWRFSFDRTTGDLFIGDAGQYTWEEADYQPAGDAVLHNYGWRLMEGNHCYNPTSGCDPGGLTPPILEYQHNGSLCVIVGGYRYRGASSPLLSATYVYADYCAGQIFGAVQSGPTWSSSLLIDASFPVSTFGEDEDAELYVADYGGGALYRLVDDTDTDGDAVLDAVDNCPLDANATQTNTDSGPPPPAGDTGTIDNGAGIAATDKTLPNGDATGDACDPDHDNDGIADSTDTEPLTAASCDGLFVGATDGHPNPAFGDNTDVDGTGPSWDTDRDGVLDGAECQLGFNPRSPSSKPTMAQCGGGGDADVDGLPASAEACRWGTSDTSADSDRDGIKDCVEANDTNGDGVANFPADTVNSAKAANNLIQKTMDFDLNGDGFVTFPGDTILSAKIVNHVGSVCL